MLLIPKDLLADADDAALKKFAEKADRWRQDEVRIEGKDLTNEVLAAVEKLAQDHKEISLRRQARAMLDARDGKLPNAPKLSAAPEIITAYLKKDLIKGWVWKRNEDEKLIPYLVTKIEVKYPERGYDSSPYLTISLAAAGTTETNRRNREQGITKHSVTLQTEDVLRKNAVDILNSARLYKETQELHDEYEVTTAKYKDVLTKGFAQQFVFDGMWYSDYKWTPRRSKVVHDLRHATPFGNYAHSTLLEDDGDLPIHPYIKVFDLKAHDYAWVHSNDLSWYKWDDTLGGKLVLPQTQRELLDILTTDIGFFSEDIVAGKSAGNVIVCKGKPGVGKTLTAEVYSEITHRPLYSIHSGTLGTQPDEIRKRLEKAFERTKRWGAVLLLDEADVFVLERKDNIVQNAIVAEFLRTMEYFDGLMFLTTNRPDDIDDAILSRAAAIIDYHAPDGDDAERVWQVLSDNIEMGLDLPLIEKLVQHFPDVAPRDIKMLCRLTKRMAHHRKEEPSLDTFRQASIFRGIKYVD